MKSDLTLRLADRLSKLRAAKGWTLDQLAATSGVSRAALSRLENAEVSPSADVLDKLAGAHDMSLSRLLFTVEDGFAAHVRRDTQSVWRDQATGYVRRTVSPGAAALAGEIVECRLPPGTAVIQESPAVAGQEHHLVILSGYMRVELDGETHDLAPGDVLRYRQHAGVRFVTAKGQGAKYMICLVTA
ncbi:helix-turn-helix domain-containing protein [Pseudoponticoccus marisrubri]|uniref:XRE family transcriptional regulator n=1 Tax=Pseudoponticoccus marisrubri TaxID=1685382 RepID=A0A0W7WMH9_9RHOB|nr:XRE family transcriptional regulator [Pseudoponticoccus marisrubri]KUF11801.1 XRE family transcriptional regulator [Pseudoponticoccus marisrubri]